MPDASNISASIGSSQRLRSASSRLRLSPCDRSWQVDVLQQENSALASELLQTRQYAERLRALVSGRGSK